jgi:hypothetical protein
MNRKSSTPAAPSNRSATTNSTKDKGLPYDPAEDGFVFSNHELERHANNMANFLHYAHA